jgi:hypothetical protein
VPSFESESVESLEINVDIGAVANALLNDQGFIDAVSSKIRKEMTKDARRLGNLFGQWAGK